MIIYYSRIISRSRWFRASWVRNSWVFPSFIPKKKESCLQLNFVSFALLGPFWQCWLPFDMKHKLWSWCICTSLYTGIDSPDDQFYFKVTCYFWLTYLSFSFCMIQSWLINTYIMTKLVCNQAQLFHNMQHSGIYAKTNTKASVDQVEQRQGRLRQGLVLVTSRYRCGLQCCRLPPAL